MSATKSSAEQAVLEVLGANPNASVSEIAAAADLGRSTAGKALAALEAATRVRRNPGGREGSRRLPDRWTLVTREGLEEPIASAGRLRPGQLDVLAGAGTAFSFVPISIAALTGVRQPQTGLASGLMNTSMQLGTALGIAIASSVAVSRTDALVRTGTAVPSALAGGYQHALWVLGLIAVLALPLTFALLRGPRPASRVTEPAAREAVPATS